MVTTQKDQDILIQYVCNIRVRLGLHDAGIETCSPSGLILLQICGPKADIEQMQSELQKVPYVKVKLMSLEF